MGKQEKPKQKILIADGSEQHREQLAALLEGGLEVVTVENGGQVIMELQDRATDFSLLLLNMDLPERDGFEVLAYMNKYHWIEEVPVVMISDAASSSYIERAYSLGVTDFIHYPFDEAILHHRVANAILLNKQKLKLMNIVADQVYEKERSDKLMISILSHIVEFRNGESGLHVLHINKITDMLLKKLVEKTDQYDLSEEDIRLIGTASALHDIGKISIPMEVLNKPGRLTAEEFEIVKTHPVIGSEMLNDLPMVQKQEPLVEVAYEITRWHHERYDGRGYPDGLQGEEIPISAQVVALADVYDALTSKRCYKEGYTHERAMEMIQNGQCGAFNPLLLECLQEISDDLKKEIKIKYHADYSVRDMHHIVEMLQKYDLSASTMRIQRSEFYRQQIQFLFTTSTEPIFRYTSSPPLLHMNQCGMDLFHMDAAIVEMEGIDGFRPYMEEETFRNLHQRIQATTPEKPEVVMDAAFLIDGKTRWYRCVLITLWSATSAETYSGMVGRLIDIHEKKTQLHQAKHAIQNGEAFLFGRRNHLREGYYSVTGMEAWMLIQCLQRINDVVRLVDAGIKSQVTVDDTGEVQKCSHQCYKMWEKNSPCENCISAKCLCGHSRVDKFEFVGDIAYYVQALYLEIDGQPYALELVNRVTEETMLGGYGKEGLMEYISEHNQKMYIDTVTQVYNRRYFEEQLSGLHRADGVAMIDINDFGKVNDSYGHQMGDIALRKIAETIQGCVRETDLVVRYGGDAFAVIFDQISEAAFVEKLEQIPAAVISLQIDEVPGLSFSVSVGGAFGDGTTADLLCAAEERMMQEKRAQNPTYTEGDLRNCQTNMVGLA